LLGEYVLKKVIAFLDLMKLPDDQDFYISMNLCPTELQDKNLVSDMVRVLDMRGVLHRRLVIELTERTLLTDLPAANSVLAGLRKEGIRVAIDDFGTGYSSLSYLKRLPLYFLKIDQSFVRGLASDSRDQAIVKATIVMAQSLNLKTIAEGVETQEQLSFLQEHGCDEIQGYFFSRPLPAEEIPAILTKGYL